MFDGMMRSFLNVIGISGEEAGNMARNVMESVRAVDARLERIERALKIETKTSEGAENGDHISRISDGADSDT